MRLEICAIERISKEYSSLHDNKSSLEVRKVRLVSRCFVVSSSFCDFGISSFVCVLCIVLALARYEIKVQLLYIIYKVLHSFFS
jgi:hypothetical protein